MNQKFWNLCGVYKKWWPTFENFFRFFLHCLLAKNPLWNFKIAIILKLKKHTFEKQRNGHNSELEEGWGGVKNFSRFFLHQGVPFGRVGTKIQPMVLIYPLSGQTHWTTQSLRVGFWARMHRKKNLNKYEKISYYSLYTPNKFQNFWLR